MSRLENFRKLREHPMIGKDFKKLSQAELTICEIFIQEREGMTNDQFMHDANRWYLDQPKPKNYDYMWGLVIQSKE